MIEVRKKKTIHLMNSCWILLRLIILSLCPLNSLPLLLKFTPLRLIYFWSKIGSLRVLFWLIDHLRLPPKSHRGLLACRGEFRSNWLWKMQWNRWKLKWTSFIIIIDYWHSNLISIQIYLYKIYLSKFCPNSITDWILKIKMVIKQFMGKIENHDESRR